MYRGKNVDGLIEYFKNIDTITFITHKNCMDGVGSVIAAKNSLNVYMDIVWMQHGDDIDIESFRGEDIIMSDFSLPREKMIELNEVANNLLVIDHHKTAMKELEDLDYVVFDLDSSGVTLTWQVFNPGVNIPSILLYIEDRDLWKWELPDSKEISEGLRYVNDQESLLNLKISNEDEVLEKAKLIGNVLVNVTNSHIEKVTKDFITIDVLGYEVPFLNNQTAISEVGNELAKEYIASISWFVTSNDIIVLSLRSNNKLDVGALCKKLHDEYGALSGGGHPNAAGCTFSPEVLDLSRLLTTKKLTDALIRDIK